ncbi:MAG: hypothetical protein ACKO0Z_01835 [Betaproteobacteria bacterium]
MLIIEQQSNGKNIVKIKKDWHPGRIGRAYKPSKSYVPDPMMERLQTALLDKRGQWK